MSHHHKSLDHKYAKFKKTQLTSDQANVATYQDPNLIGAWGIVIIDDNVWIPSYGLVTNYDKKGNLLYHVALPTILGNVVFGTGVVANNTTGFVITNGSNTATSTILIACKSGAVFGYSPLVDPINAIKVIDNSHNNAVYTGITIIGNYLCIADYFNNRIDVYNSNFVQVFTLPFADLEVLNPLPDDVAPYNITNINGLIYIVYARQPDSSGIVPPFAQISYVSVFNKNGLFIKRFINEHHSNSWALVRLPKCFEKLGKKYLLGNTDGTISIYNKYGDKIGIVRDKKGCKLIIYELKGLDVNDDIYFTSAPLSGFDDNPILGMHGLFGQLKYLCYEKKLNCQHHLY